MTRVSIEDRVKLTSDPVAVGVIADVVDEKGTLSITYEVEVQAVTEPAASTPAAKKAAAKKAAAAKAKSETDTETATAEFAHVSTKSGRDPEGTLYWFVYNPQEKIHKVQHLGKGVEKGVVVYRD